MSGNAQAVSRRLLADSLQPPALNSKTVPEQQSIAALDS